MTSSPPLILLNGLVLSATGGTGRIIIRDALAQGPKVTALNQVQTD